MGARRQPERTRTRQPTRRRSSYVGTRDYMTRAETFPLDWRAAQGLNSVVTLKLCTPDHGVADRSRTSASILSPACSNREMRVVFDDIGYVTGPKPTVPDGSSATTSIVTVPMAGAITCT